MTKRNRMMMCLLVGLCASTTIACQNSTSATAAPASAASSAFAFSGGFFALSVTDATTSAEWYSEKLGLKITMRPPKTDNATVVVLEGEGLIVELIQSDDGVDLTQVAPSIQDRTLVHGIVKVGAIVDDLDKTVATLRDHKVEIAFGPFPATAQQRANVIIRDNEGNLIQLFGRR